MGFDEEGERREGWFTLAIYCMFRGVCTGTRCTVCAKEKRGGFKMLSEVLLCFARCAAQHCAVCRVEGERCALFKTRGEGETLLTGWQFRVRKGE